MPHTSQCMAMGNGNWQLREFGIHKTIMLKNAYLYL